MLDAFALVADVLSFYDERIANEGYLATATDDCRCCSSRARSDTS